MTYVYDSGLHEKDAAGTIVEIDGACDRIVRFSGPFPELIKLARDRPGVADQEYDFPLRGKGRRHLQEYCVHCEYVPNIVVRN